MRKLFILLCLVAFPVPVHAFQLGDYYSGGSGGSGGLSNTEAWTLASGLELKGSGEIALTNLVFSDDFTGTELGANWNSVTDGSGAVTLSTLYDWVVLNSPAAADVSALYYNTPVASDRSTQNWKAEAVLAVQDDSDDVQKFMLHVWTDATHPVATAIADSTDNSVFSHLIVTGTSDEYRARAFTTGATYEYANAGSFYENAGFATEAKKFQTAGEMTADLLYGAVNRKTVLQGYFGPNDVPWNYSYVTRPYATIAGAGTDVIPQLAYTFVMIGDIINNQKDGVIFVKEFRYYEDFPTTDPQACSPTETFTGPIVDVPIVEGTCAGGISWSYDLNGAGLVTPSGGTLAALKTALIGQPDGTVQICGDLGSNGDTPCSFALTGGSLTSFH